MDKALIGFIMGLITFSTLNYALETERTLTPYSACYAIQEDSVITSCKGMDYSKGAWRP